MSEKTAHHVTVYNRYCPLRAAPCRSDCAWYLEDTAECAVSALGRSLSFFVDYDWEDRVKGLVDPQDSFVVFPPPEGEVESQE